MTSAPSRLYAPTHAGLQPPHTPAEISVHAAERLLLGLAGLGLTLVLATWFSTTPQITSPAAAVVGAGQITGLAGAWACLVLLALMSRLPLLEYRIGADRLARWHAHMGRWSVLVLLAHALLITLGYSLQGRISLWAQIGAMAGYEHVLAATIALALLLVVGVTSARAARARLSHANWYHIHLTTYVALFLAFGHQIAVGSQFATSPTLAAIWRGAWLGVAALVTIWRVLVPLLHLITQQARVRALIPEGPGVASVCIRGRNISRLEPRAGQFFRVRVLRRGQWWSANPFSLSAPVRGDEIRLTVKDLGSHSRALLDTPPGTRVVLEGPFGALHAGRAQTDEVVCIAAGIGITPIRAILEEIPQSSRVTLLYRTPTREEAVLAAELDSLARSRGVGVHYLTGSRAEARITPERFATLGLDPRECDVFLCGPPSFMADTQSALEAAGVPSQRIHLEYFEL